MKNALPTFLLRMKRSIDAVQEELKNKQFEGHAAGGAVNLAINGAGELLSLEISQEAYAEGPEAVAALIKSAFMEAHGRKEAATREALSRAGLNAMNPFSRI